MSIRDRLLGTSEARAEYRDAKTELAQVAKRDRDETDDYLAANDRVVATEQHLPRWRRAS
jgi:hypothetical protein